MRTPGPRRHHRPRTPLPWLLACLLIALTPTTWAAQAGVVLVASGAVQADGAEGGSRDLRRRSQLFEQDTVATGPDSRTQLKLVDDAVISLQESSALSISEYRYNDPSGKPDKALLRLVRGGLRTVTGSIGAENRDAYSLETPLASIGIRGTAFSVTITGTGDEMVVEVAVYDGAIVVETPSGGIRVGTGENYQAIRIHADGRIEYIRFDEEQSGGPGGGIDSSAGEPSPHPAAGGDDQDDFESNIEESQPIVLP